MHRLLNNFPNTLRLLSLRNCYRNEQAVILCPGSSMDRVDLSLLEGHQHIQGTNGFYAKWQLPFRHFFCSSILFYGANNIDVPQLQCDKWFLANYLKTKPTTRDWSWPAEKRTYWLSLDIPPVNARDRLHYPVVTNVLRILPWGPTVLFDLMMPMLMWMGYTEILLVGVDYNTFTYTYCAPNDNSGPTQPTGIDANERSMEMQLAHQRSIEWQAWLEENRPQTKVINCSPGSQLPGFAHGKIEDYI